MSRMTNRYIPDVVIYGGVSTAAMVEQVKPKVSFFQSVVPGMDYVSWYMTWGELLQTVAIVVAVGTAIVRLSWACYQTCRRFRRSE